MVKQIFPAIIGVFFLSSCSTLKSLNFTANKKENPAPTTVSNTKFIETITVTPQPNAVDKTEVRPAPPVTPINPNNSPAQVAKQQHGEDALSEILSRREAEVEAASAVQLKYAVLLNTEVESLPSKELLESVDEWFGVRYSRGGNTKKGVDCSGFSVAVYAAVYGITLPRVSREQYRISRKISTTELQEGDLVFFDTRGRGSVSHVGIYLGNNKFIHASVSKGVMVNDLFQSYYLHRYIGAGRIESKSTVAVPTP
jgi:cell wall-associated NlpC family hydrolase